jgi:hypothetical protein
MLSVSEAYIRKLNRDAKPLLFGQDWNDEARAVPRCLQNLQAHHPTFPETCICGAPSGATHRRPRVAISNHRIALRFIPLRLRPTRSRAAELKMLYVMLFMWLSEHRTFRPAPSRRGLSHLRRNSGSWSSGTSVTLKGDFCVTPEEARSKGRRTGTKWERGFLTACLLLRCLDREG